MTTLTLWEFHDEDHRLHRLAVRELPDKTTEVVVEQFDPDDGSWQTEHRIATGTHLNLPGYNPGRRTWGRDR